MAISSIELAEGFVIITESNEDYYDLLPVGQGRFSYGVIQNVATTSGWAEGDFVVFKNDSTVQPFTQISGQIYLLVPETNIYFKEDTPP